jgi:isoamylase
MSLKLLRGQPNPLGATWDGTGVNFALFSRHATKVELCLFDTTKARRETQRIPLRERTNNVWHVYLPDVRPGQLYGYRVYGPYQPESGHRFNPKKIVLDPYAKAIARKVRWYDSMFGYRLQSPRQDLTIDTRDNAPHAPLGVVVDTAFTWGNDRHPNVPLNETILYEAHVKGMTMLHPGVPEKLRGTYAGMATEPIINHLKSLGVTSIELLPVHTSVDESHVVRNALSNYWGYNTLGYFAPDPRLAAATDPQEIVREFKTMVRAFHDAGLEVILDVVYNHTGEGNHLGPTLSFKGIDNASYYRLVPESPRYYMDFTGCGNTLDTTQPWVLRMMLDSLRYWVEEMHVDGFRFDLTSALGRDHYDFNPYNSFFDALYQDPVLSQVKLMAEPWDASMGGYQVGNYPPPWMEWNGKYRDIVRSFWNLQGSSLDQLATRVAGSSDLFQHNGRSPVHSVNFVTCHDGFCLQDLVSYNYKHNEANGEDNRDGANDNLSWNCGEEGRTAKAEVNALRARQKRNLLTTLMLSFGTPMLHHGDELSASKLGNNNTYCQDNELNWLDWKLEGPEERAFLQFTRRLIAIRRQEPVFRRWRFFRGEPSQVSGIHDIYWFSSEGHDMTLEDWHSPQVKAFGYLLEGNAIGERDETGQWLRGDSVLVLINGSSNDVPFSVPVHHRRAAWEVILDTTTAEGTPRLPKTLWDTEECYPLMSRSMVVFKLRTQEG